MSNDHSGGFGIDLKHFRDFLLEGIQFAWPFDHGPCGVWIIEVSDYGLSVEVDPPGNFSNGESFIGETMDLKDAVLIDHDLLQ